MFLNLKNVSFIIYYKLICSKKRNILGVQISSVRFLCSKMHLFQNKMNEQID